MTYSFRDLYITENLLMSHLAILVNIYLIFNVYTQRTCSNKLSCQHQTLNTHNCINGATFPAQLRAKYTQPDHMTYPFRDLYIIQNPMMSLLAILVTIYLILNVFTQRARIEQLELSICQLLCYIYKNVAHDT